MPRIILSALERLLECNHCGSLVAVSWDDIIKKEEKEIYPNREYSTESDSSWKQQFRQTDCFMCPDCNALSEDNTEINLRGGDDALKKRLFQ